METKLRPKCAYCQREFAPGGAWSGANYCRAAYLLPIIAAQPGKTAWELHEISGIPYSQVTSALQKARDWELLTWEAEDREAGGQRFRYTVAENWQEAVAEWRRRGLV